LIIKMSLLKFGFSTSKVNVAQAARAKVLTLPEDRQKQKKEYEKKRERKFREEWKQDFSWLDYDREKNTMSCTVCPRFPRLADKGSSFVSGSSSFRLQHIVSHGQSFHHTQCLAAANAQERPNEAPLNAQVMRMEEGQRHRLTHIFDLGYFIVKSELPFATFPRLVDVTIKIGADVGDCYKSDNALRR
jgi:hypothetical protein